jgi:hypothetical protein
MAEEKDSIEMFEKFSDSFQKQYGTDYINALALIHIWEESGKIEKIKNIDDLMNRLSAFNDHNGKSFKKTKILFITKRLINKDKKYNFLRFYFEFIINDMKNVLKEA